MCSGLRISFPHALYEWVSHHFEADRTNDRRSGSRFG